MPDKCSWGRKAGRLRGPGILFQFWEPIIPDVFPGDRVDTELTASDSRALRISASIPLSLLTRSVELEPFFSRALHS